MEPGRDPVSDLDALESELGQYQGTFGELLAKPRLVALNKVDVPEARELGQHALAEAVVRRDQEQDLKAADRREAPVGFDTIEVIAGRVAVDDGGRIAVKQ